MATAPEHRRHCQDFVTDIAALCTRPGIRAVLKRGRGRPVEDCLDLTPHLSRLTRGHGARRAHYTVAALIALTTPTVPAATDPFDENTTPAADTGEDPYRTPAWRRRPDLGTTLATAARDHGFNPGRTEDDLKVLVRLGEDQTHRRLPALAERLAAAGLRPDWAVLLDDLAVRAHTAGQVGTRWLDNFYLRLDTVKDPT
ncbi:CRISPR-associated protein Cse2 (CRISPR_cse2) [Streptomyces sp. TLI_053]|uniref:type I-E CRISPR-associated protein Cse2/CasB n=1 Tax=Streptomyces sp. TLI_053 TaxID=1855352 RepID=UPI00087B2F14|nr:type I-E CRISPR-associated protein Cse2/CasB [Streptomyces sp. TLI_053]SDS49903.1 CRISPR-associated protein Cse2 (CRISPR_cse2) [Streptomyces sp. TLI_053]